MRIPGKNRTILPRRSYFTVSMHHILKRGDRMSTDKEWEKWGKTDPYFGVLTAPQFRTKNLNDETKKEFFDSGVKDVEHAVDMVKRHIAPAFKPRRALDFGCGTGRLVIPLAAIANEVVGVDVAESMLECARANCEERSIRNVSFVQGDDTLSGIKGSFDFIHSYIVLQHIPPQRGIDIIRRLLSLLDDNGIGVLQVTYANWKFTGNFGKPTHQLIKRLLRTPKKLVTGIFNHSKEPEMEMNKYDLNQIIFMMQQAGIRSFFAEYTDHGGELGAYFCFQKTKRK